MRLAAEEEQLVAYASMPEERGDVAGLETPVMETRSGGDNRRVGASVSQGDVSKLHTESPTSNPDSISDKHKHSNAERKLRPESYGLRA
jgi:hypothetical protein